MMGIALVNAVVYHRENGSHNITGFTRRRGVRPSANDSAGAVSAASAVAPSVVLLLLLPLLMMMVPRDRYKSRLSLWYTLASA